MFKLLFRKDRGTRDLLPTSVESQKKQENSRKTSASLTTLKPSCRSQQTVENALIDGNTRPPYLPPEKPVCRSTFRNRCGTADCFLIGKGVHQGCLLSPCLFNFYAEFSSVQSVQSLSCVRLCDPMNCSTPGLPVHHQLPEFTQSHVHRVSHAIQPSHPLSSSSPPAPSRSQHQSLPQ